MERNKKMIGHLEDQIGLKVEKECKNVKENVGLLDMTAFGKQNKRAVFSKNF